MLNASKQRYRFRFVVPAFSEFNIYTSVANMTTALGPVCVATAASKVERWDVEIIDENNLGREGPRMRAPKRGADHSILQSIRTADVVGLYGGLTSTVPRLYEVAAFYKKEGVITVAGGQHFADGENAEEALDSGVDYIIVGEGEEAIQELLSALMGGRALDSVQGLVYRENGVTKRNPPRALLTNFEHLPLPDFSLVRYAKITLYPVERIRGCGMECEFCTVRGRPRCASPERLMEHISTLVETRDARVFFVVDDLFGQQREETIRFCEMLRDYQKAIGRRLMFNVQIRLDKARDTQLLTVMREAGVNFLAIGFESPIEEELKAMHKKIKPQEMVELARIYHKHGFWVHGMFIFNYPMADGAVVKLPLAERVKVFRRFFRQAKIDTIQVLLPVPLPATELRARLMKQGRVYPKDQVGWEYYDGNFPLFEPDPPNKPLEIQDAAIRQIMGGFYRFRHMFIIGAQIVTFPTIVFYLGNLQYGWGRWYRSWRNALLRFGGSFVVRGWKSRFSKDPFSDKLRSAQKLIVPASKSTTTTTPTH